MGDLKQFTENDRIVMFDKVFRKMVSNDTRKWLIENGFFRQAASTRFHGAYAGGLFDHSLSVMKNLIMLTDKLELEWKRIESPFIVGMFHDLCKIDQYEIKDNGVIKWRKSDLSGHGDKSVVMLSKLMFLTDEEMKCIRYHMGAFTDQEEWKDYTEAIHQYPNVLFVHTADMMASHIEMT